MKIEDIWEDLVPVDEHPEFLTRRSYFTAGTTDEFELLALKTEFLQRYLKERVGQA